MIRTIYGDHQRCKDVYFSTYKGKYLLEMVVKEILMAFTELLEELMMSSMFQVIE